MKKLVFIILQSGTIGWAQLQFTMNGIQHTIPGNKIATSTLGAETTEVYIHLRNDTIDYNYLTHTNRSYTSRLQVLAPINQLEVQLSNVSVLYLGDERKAGGMCHIPTYDGKEVIIYKQYSSSDPESVNTSSVINIVCDDLNDAIFFRWKVSRLLKDKIPDRKLTVRHRSWMVPAIPVYYYLGKDKNEDNKNTAYYYQIKNDSIYLYKINDMEEYSGKCGSINIERAALSKITKKNMEVRKPYSTEYDVGPEKDAYLVAIGSPGKFIVTSSFYTGNYKSDIEQAFMLIVCSNKEMADEVYQEILKAL